MINLNEESELRSELDGIYISLEAAKNEIWRRWNDETLRKKVELFLEGDLPEIFRTAPRAIVARQVLSPNFEMLHFSDLAKKIDLRPVCFGYLDDKLVTKNLDKYYLCKLFFYDGLGRNGGEKLSSLNIVDFNKWNGKRFRDVKTIFGTSFVDFHNAFARLTGSDIDFFDASHFLKNKGSLSKNYYRYFLSLFICHGVLFENYLLNGEYGDLTRDVFLPNYRKVSEIFGVKPLIVRAVSLEEEENLRWRHYPQSVYGTIEKIIQSNNI